MVSLRLTRLLRLGGLVRLLRFFKPLYLLVAGIMVSLKRLGDSFFATCVASVASFLGNLQLVPLMVSLLQFYIEQLKHVKTKHWYLFGELSRAEPCFKGPWSGRGSWWVWQPNGGFKGWGFPQKFVAFHVQKMQEILFRTVGLHKVSDFWVFFGNQVSSSTSSASCFTEP